MIFNSVSRREGVAAASSFVGYTTTKSGMDEGGRKGKDGTAVRADKTATAVNIAGRIREEGVGNCLG